MGIITEEKTMVSLFNISETLEVEEIMNRRKITMIKKKKAFDFRSIQSKNASLLDSCLNNDNDQEC